MPREHRFTPPFHVPRAVKIGGLWYKKRHAFHLFLSSVRRATLFEGHIYDAMAHGVFRPEMPADLWPT